MHQFLYMSSILFGICTGVDPPTLIFSGASALTSEYQRCTCTASLAVTNRFATTALTCAALEGDEWSGTTVKTKTFPKDEWEHTFKQAGINSTVTRAECTPSDLSKEYQYGAAAVAILVVGLLGLLTWQCCKA